MLPTLSQIFYYTITAIAIYILFYLRANPDPQPTRNLITTICIIFISSEFWELPIFILGFSGLAYWWPYPEPIFLLNHIIVAFMFIILWFIHKPNIHIIGTCLLTALAINILLLYPIDYIQIGTVFISLSLRGWIARSVGLLALTLGVYYGSSLVVVKSKSL